MDNRVLVFEDNPINARLTEMFLGKSGFTAEIAANMQSFEEMLLKGYKAVLVDMSSPALNTKDIMEMIKRSKSLTPPTPFIAIINSNMNDESVIYINMGFSSFLAKPLNAKSLDDALKSAMSTQSAPPKDEEIDLEQAGKSLGISDQAVLKDIFNQFFKNLTGDFAKLYKAAEEKNYPAIREAAHSIKGSSRNLRLASIGVLAEEIERFAKAGEDRDYKSAIEHLQQVTNATLESFKKRYS